MPNVGDSIYYYRLEKGLTQSELAVRSGVPQPNLSAIEKGRDLKVSTLYQLAVALEVDVVDLLKGPSPLELNKDKFFSRQSIDQVVESLAGIGGPLRDLSSREAVMLLKPLLESTLRGKSKKLLHRQWMKIRKTFTHEELEGIAARVEKARQKREGL